MTKSYLSKKDRDSLHWRGQVQKLRRIAVRATKNADHLEELLSDYYVRYPEGADDVRAKVVSQRARATGAAEEMLAIAKANGDPRVALVR